MAINFNQVIAAWASASPSASASFTPAGGDAFVIIGGTGSTGTANITQSASTGPAMSGLAINGSGTNFNDGFTDTWSAWTQFNAVGSPTTVTLISAGNGMNGIGLDYSGVGAISNCQLTVKATPGVGVGAIAGAALVVPAGSVLVAYCFCISGQDGNLVTAGSPSNTRIARQFQSSLMDTILAVDYFGGGASVTPQFTSSSGASQDYVVAQYLQAPLLAVGPGPMPRLLYTMP